MTGLIAEQSHADWATFQGDAAHDGYVAGVYDPKSFKLAWQYATTPGGTYLEQRSLAVGGGKVYLSRGYYYEYNTQPNLFAFNDLNGSIVWTKGSGTYFDAPALANGKVYVAETGEPTAWLWGFDASSGNQLTQSPISSQQDTYYAPTIAGGTAYVDGGYYGGMYSFNANNGQQNWWRSLPQFDKWTPAIDSNYAYAYFGSYTEGFNPPGFYALDRQTGQLAFQINPTWKSWDVWSHAPVLGSQHDAVVINLGTEYEDGQLMSFDLQNRTVQWTQSIPWYTKEQPTIANGNIFLISGNTVQARSEVTGDLLWDWSVDNDYLNGTIIATDNLLFVCGNDTTYAIDLLTHSEVWSYSEAGVLALDNNALYIASSTDTLTKVALPEPELCAVLAFFWLLINRCPSRI